MKLFRIGDRVGMLDAGRSESNLRKLRGNEVLVLDEPGSLWVIEQGGVALFAVPVRNGVPTGPRRFFFASATGDGLFGMPRVADGAPTVIAVALSETTLRRQPLPAGGADAGSAELGHRWVDRWVESAGLAPPATSTAASGRSFLSGFHDDLLQRLAALDQRQTERERAGLLERERRALDATRRAASELSSVLRPGRDFEPLGSGLFAAASMVARAQGIDLSRPAGWEADPSSEPIERIARASRVRARRILLHDSWWTQDCGPIVGFLRDGGQPVALLRRSPGSYWIDDPASHTRRRVDAGIAAQLDPQAYVLYRPLPARASHVLGLLGFALAGRGRDLALVLLSAAAATLLGMFTPQAMALIVDQALPDQRPLLFQIGLGLLAAAIGTALFRLSQGIVMLRVETAADSVTQSAVWDRLLGLQLAFFRRFTTGDLQSRVSAISQIRSTLGGTTLRTLLSSLLLLLNLGLLLYYSPSLTLVAIGVAAVSVAITIGSGVMILKQIRQVLELKGRFFGFMVQLINGVAKLRVAAAEQRAFARWASEYSQLLRLELRQRRIQDSVEVINIAVSTLSAIVLFSLASTLIRGSGSGATLTTGVFLAFHIAYGTFIGAIVNLSVTITDVMGIAILRERARPILEAPLEVTEKKTDPGRLSGKLQVERVTFRYRDDGPEVLDDVSLTIEPGQFAAFVGPSGGGKSTLFRLLLGFDAPRSGSIYYDEQELSGLDLHALRRQMGVVLQNGRINAGSIHDNIASGTSISLDDAWRAARDAGFEDDISAMPMGMHTIVSEGGTNLSGGQRQRLLLARALVHQPAILLLDEATSSLDNTTQAIVIQSLERLRVTRLVIAHRLSTIRRADRIYVIGSGRVVEEGSFDELAKRGEVFSRLIARQLT